MQQEIPWDFPLHKNPPGRNQLQGSLREDTQHREGSVGKGELEWKSIMEILEDSMCPNH